MAQIFHPSTNTIAKLSIVGVVLLLPAVSVAGYWWNMSYGINHKMAIEQPSGHDDNRRLRAPQR